MNLPKKLFKSKLEIFSFLIVLLFACALRGQEIITNNYLFLIDQGRDMLGVKNIIFNHHLTLIGPYTSLGGVFQGPLWYYLLSIPTLLTQGDPIGPLVLMFLISITTILIVYFWTNKIFGYKTAIITFILFAISPEAVAAATYSWNPHPMWLLLTIYCFSLFKIVSKKVRFHLLLWPVIGLMFHFEMALGVFILGGTILFFLLFHRKKLLSKYVLLGFAFLGLCFLPQVLFDIRHDFLMLRSVSIIFSGQDQGLLVKGESRQYLELLNNHFFAFIENYKSGFLHEGLFKNFPLFVFVFTLFSVLLNSKIKFLSPNEECFVNTILKIVLIVMLLTFFYPFPIRYWFLTGFQTFYILITGVLLSKLLNYNIGKAIIVFLCLAFFKNTVDRLDTLYIHPPDDGGVAKIKGKKAAIDYIYNDAKEEKFGLLIFNPPVYTDAYDYLVWWYGGKKYNYLPHKEKKGTFYLLIEVDNNKPWSYKGWIETVVKTGKILKTKELPSGFIVQKRVQDNNNYELSIFKTL